MAAQDAARCGQTVMQQSNKPDLFIPIFVAVALGGYSLLLVFDAIQNGFCIPFVGTCFGVEQQTGWGSF